MRPTTRLTGHFVACLAIFSQFANAFWRLPCRGRAGVARLDPLVNPGGLSYHVHTIQGSGNFAMTVTEDSLRQANCTSCAVTQDKSSYWAPALYFIHANGSAELVEQDGGMLVYYLLYGDNVTAFPNNFRMLAGDSFQRNFTWPVPDPPKSEWSGDQLSQAALRQKAIGFNCLNYNVDPEPSLYRHYLPSKAYMDEHCADGVRFELMFPSCWNGKDVDSSDHKSHMAYPSLVMDGECPPGFETRLVSLLYETIWNTPAFKDEDGTFIISNGDPTGFGYHGDFIQGWDPDLLQEAVDTCTSETGVITECDVFDIQSDEDQAQCKFPVPGPLKSENVYMYSDGLPGNLAIMAGPAYASPIAYENPSAAGTAISVLASSSSSPIATSAATWTASSTAVTPTTEYIQSIVTEAIVYVEREVIVTIDGQGNPIGTGIGDIEPVATSLTTVTRVVSTVVSEPTGSATGQQHAKRGHHHHNTGHINRKNSRHRHGHYGRADD